MIVKSCLVALLASALAGCSGIRFSSQDDGKSHPYRLATPALKVITDSDCKMTAEVISIPGRVNWLRFQTGLGRINDRVEFEPGGTIKSINVEQSGVADDLNKLLGTVAGALKPGGPFAATNASSANAESKKKSCTPSIEIVAIDLDSMEEAAIATTKTVVKVTAEKARD